MKLTLNIKNTGSKPPVRKNSIKTIILALLRNEKMDKPVEIGLLFTNDREIKKLNARYLSKNSPTDVIAFDLSESRGKISADIAISTEAASRNAKIYDTSCQYEAYLYIVHGILHILGYNDSDEKNRLLMHKKEKSLLNILNL